MERDYGEYKSDVESRIQNVIGDMKSQPVLFIGTGLSIRYFDAPSWENLLRKLADVEAVSRDYEYYEQTIGDEEEIAEEFADLYNDWAWTSGEHGGRSEFPPWLFDSEAPEDIYLKHKVANLLRDLTPESTNDISDKHKREIEFLNEIQPHAVITTNYDTFLEDFVFPEYEKVIGQTLIEEPYANIGEIFKIHGCVNSLGEIVLTDSDYDEFDSKKAYLSAKLLTFFTEHPILIVGYEPNDPNVRRILSDVKSALSGEDRQPNIFLVDWDDDIPERGQFNQEKLINVGGGEEMVVNYIKADDFDWIFESFSAGGEIKGVNSKLLRRLMNNTYDIIQEEAPRREIDVGTLESVANDKTEIIDILGIAPLGADDYSGGGTDRPSSIAEGGVPVGELISNEEVDDINEILDIAVEVWEDYDVLFEQREVIYTFYNQREELELNNRKIEFLLKSSLSNIIQGSEWLIRYDGDIDELLSGTTDVLNGRSIAALERNLLALGKDDMLREIADSELGESGMSNALSYAEVCDRSPPERIKEYTDDTIWYNDEDYNINNLISGSVSNVDLMEEIVQGLTEDDSTDARRALRKVELVRIVNSPLCAD